MPPIATKEEFDALVLQAEGRRSFSFRLDHGTGSSKQTVLFDAHPPSRRMRDSDIQFWILESAAA